MRSSSMWATCPYHLQNNMFHEPIPSRHKWWLAYLIFGDPNLAMKLPLPLPFLLVQTGVRLQLPLWLGLRVSSVPRYHYQFTNYITFNSVQTRGTVKTSGCTRRIYENLNGSCYAIPTKRALVRKSTPPEISPAKKWSFLSRAFYNAPSLQIVDLPWSVLFLSPKSGTKYAIICGSMVCKRMLR